MSQKRRNQTLWSDIQANLYFLSKRGQRIIEKHPTTLPFDYASVRILLGNIHFCFTRGRGELNVTLAPSHDLSQFVELSLVIAALDSGNLKPASDFESIASILSPRIDALNEVFSKTSYPEFSKNLP